jgi:hypothetical protein
MFRFVAVFLVLLFPVISSSPGGLGKPGKYKPNRKPKPKTDEEKAKAMLEKAQALLNDGKRKQARKQLRKLIRKYPKTKAGLHGAILLSFTPP